MAYTKEEREILLSLARTLEVMARRGINKKINLKKANELIKEAG